MFDKIKEWYEGEYIPYRNDPDSPVVIVGPGHLRRPVLAYMIKWTFDFWLAHWQWVITTALAIIGLIFAIRKIG